jgi:hypothetical protein
MPTTSNDNTVLPKNSIMLFSGIRKDIAEFAADIILNFEDDFLLITIITLGRSEVCCVRIVTGMSLEDIVLEKATSYLLRLLSISVEEPPTG